MDKEGEIPQYLIEELDLIKFYIIMKLIEYYDNFDLAKFLCSFVIKNLIISVRFFIP